MTFKSYRELVCWQLSVQLRDALIEITDRPTVSRNFKYCVQVGASTRSAVSSIAVGFGRSNKEFHRYLQISLGSLQETENHVDEALKRRYISRLEHEQLRRLAKRAHQAALGLCHYLERRIQQDARQRRARSKRGRRRTTDQPDQPN
jgi:four helix bundle protein